MSAKLRAFFFDLDGTVLNTVDMIVDSFKVACAAIDHEVSTEQIKSGIGMTMEEFVPKLLGDRLAEKEQFLDSYFGYQRDFGNSTITVFNEILPLLKMLKEKSIPMGVVTSRRRDSALELCENLGLLPFFDIFVCAGEASRNKPFGDPLLLALYKLNEIYSDDEFEHIKPDECVYFGDAIHDIEAASDANFMSVLVDWSKVDRVRSEEMADLVYKEAQDIEKYI